MAAVSTMRHLGVHLLFLLCIQLIDGNPDGALISHGNKDLKVRPESFKNDEQTVSSGHHNLPQIDTVATSMDISKNSFGNERPQSEPVVEGNNQDAVPRGRHFWDCPPCRCQSSDGGFVHASCVNKRLSYIPRTLPKRVKSIDMESNSLKSLNTTELLFYEHLFRVDLSKNEITSICGEPSQNVSSSIKELILSSNKIRGIGEGSFLTLSRLENLDLSSNKISILNSTTFQGLSSLTILDLSSNLIRHIYNGSFDEILSLRYLFLTKNTNLGYLKNMSPSIFKSLKNLRELRIQGSSKNGGYPSAGLSQLVSLESLYVDGLGDGYEFGPSMKNLINLKALSFGPDAYCRFKNISASFFVNLPYLTSLSFERCSFHYIDPKAFTFLPNLSNYNVSYSQTYDLDLAFESLKGFQNGSLKNVSFIKLFHTSPPCRTLNKTHGKYLWNLNITLLDLSFNRLALFENTFLDQLPPSLEVLILKKNRFTLEANLWFRLHKLKNLKTLNIEDQDPNLIHSSPLNTVQRYKERYAGIENALYTTLTDEINNMPPSPISKLIDTSLLESEDDSLGPRSHLMHETNESYREIVSSAKKGLPPKLQTVLASRYTLFGGILMSHRKLKGPVALSRVDFSFSFMDDWTLWRLPYSITYADLSHNQCYRITPSFFPEKNNLTTLFLQFNYFGPILAKDKNGEIFSNLRTLQEMDLSQNIIFSLPFKVFRGMQAIRRLRMVDNKLKYFNVSLSHMVNLTLLDLSKNSIMWISRGVRRDLDTLAKSRDIVLDLSYNSLPCTCNGQEIIKWLAFTNVSLANRDRLNCNDENGNTVRIHDLKVMVQVLERRCVDIKIMILIVASVATIIVISFITALIVRHKWTLIYIKNTILVKWYGYKPKRHLDSTLKYDAYIVYSEMDSDFVFDVLMPEMETNRKHRLCIEDTDFVSRTGISFLAPSSTTASPAQYKTVLT